jgi:gamma-glutamyltranspeptidase/glutathione hydrolase
VDGDRPLVMGTRAMVVTGHPLATRAAARVLACGGNAVDAGVAAGLTLGVVHPDMVSISGVAPILIHMKQSQPTTISGLGRWPRTAALDWYRERFGEQLPAGVLQWVVPGALDAWITALEQHGRLRFEAVAADAIALAKDGFAVTPFTAYNIRRQGETVWQWAENDRIFLGGARRAPAVGERLRQRELGALLQSLTDASAAASSRERGLAAARDTFYRGAIGKRLANYCQEQGGLLQWEDLADFRVKVEAPVRATFHDLEIVGCGPWCQGPVLQMILKMLEGYDLKAMGHNSPAYIHTLTEAFKLAMADRETYFGDPEFTPVPVAGLLHPGYARERARLIRPDRAWSEMPPAGNPLVYDETAWGSGGTLTAPVARRRFTGPQDQAEPKPDTSFVAIVDEEGNAFTATPSDPATDNPLVPGLGLGGSSRGRQSRLLPDHPSSLGPGKRPRLTPMPAMVLRSGEPWLLFGTPGGDVQPQAMTQVLLNLTAFAMPPQAAVEAPRFATYSFPDSFAPHAYYPGLLKLEERISAETQRSLRDLGHHVEPYGPWDWRAGGVCAIQRSADGILLAGADPRRESYALGW